MLFSPTYVPYSYMNTANMREQLYLQQQLSQTSNSTDNIRNTGLHTKYRLKYRLKYDVIGLLMLRASVDILPHGGYGMGSSEWQRPPGG